MLYIIESNTNLYKIGISKNPVKRLKQLQTGNGTKLRLVQMFLVPNERLLERKIHSMLWQCKSMNQKSEWFLLSSDALDWLISYLMTLGKQHSESTINN